MREGDFYEEDEPIEKILAILARPVDFVTGRPSMHCIVCREEIERLWDQPHGALIFHSTGNYGSTVFDPMDSTELVIYICDACVAAAGRDGMVRFQPRPLRPKYPPLEIWRP